MANEGNIVNAIFGAKPAPEPEPEDRRRHGGGGGDDLDLDLSGELRNDYGNGQRLIRRFGDDLLFVRDIGWHVFTGAHWSRPDGETRARILAHRTATAMFDEARAMKRAGPRKDRDGNPVETAEAFADRHEKAVKWAVGSGNQSKQVAMMTAAEPYLTVTADDMDIDRALLNVENGTLELGFVAVEGGASVAEVTLRPHRREDRITRLARAKYDREATCPQFDKFIAEILPDDAVRGFVQRFLGYTLTGFVSEQCLILLQGKGRNGKSTLLELVAWILGDYAMTLPIETLLQDDRRRGSEATPDLADLPGVRLAIATEPGPAAKLDEGRIKKMTGGERMKVRRLMEAFFEFFPQFKLCLAFNEAPTIRGQDDGIWRRLRVVPFEVQVQNVDLGLLDKLRGEAPGILNWLLDGYVAWREGGLQAPDKVLKATDEYRDDSDRVGQFLRAATEADAAYTITAKELYSAYQDWCRANAAEPVSGNFFGRQMKTHGFERVKVGMVFYRGLRLTQAWLDQQEAAKARRRADAGDDDPGAGDKAPPPASEGDYGND